MCIRCYLGGLGGVGGFGEGSLRKSSLGVGVSVGVFWWGKNGLCWWNCWCMWDF